MSRAHHTLPPPRKPLCPSLPPEIWISIFSYCHDLPHLWNTCRRVSRTLKACAERAFSGNHLGSVHIEFMLDRHNLGGKRGPHEPAITLQFERIGKGSEAGIAWFSGHFRGHKIVDPWMRDKTKAVIMQRWHENVEKRKPELPNYTITIGNMVNDTDIPGLVVDPTEYKMRLEWRSMLELFFREQAQLEDLRCKQLSSQASRHDASSTARKAKARKPAATAPSSQHALDAETRKAARRARLKAHYHTNAEMLWALDSLQHFEATDSAKWSSEAPAMLPHLPGAGLGERWFGSTNLVQELYLDECSSLNRIDTQTRVASTIRGG